MPRYITSSDIYGTELFHLTSTDITTATVNLFIDDAESLVDGYLARLYSVPFSSGQIPGLVTSISKELAGFYALEFLHQQGNRNLNQSMTLRYNRSLELLDKIRLNQVALIGSLSTGSIGVVAQVNTALIRATYTNAPTVVNMDDELNWRISSGQLDSISDYRLGAD